MRAAARRLLLPLLAAAGPCPAPPRAALWSADTKEAGQGPVGEYCRGLVLGPHHLLLPAHCLVAGRRLRHSEVRVEVGGRQLVRPVEAKLVYAHPGFRLQSYTGGDPAGAGQGAPGEPTRGGGGGGGAPVRQGGPRARPALPAGQLLPPDG